jgi:molybdopterin synthase catalytic subunit
MARGGVLNVADDQIWTGIGEEALSVVDAIQWATQLGCGTVRDFSDERAEVTSLEYEAYDRYAAEKLATVARSAPVVASPHRTEAFDAARFCIDTLKSTVPLWKPETWSVGVDWGTDACPLEPIEVAEGPRRSS